MQFMGLAGPLIGMAYPVNGVVLGVGGYFIAGAALRAGDVLKAGTGNGVVPTTAAGDRVLGVSRTDVGIGKPVDVVVMGVIDLTSDGPVAFGDGLGPSAVNAGRCISQNALPTSQNLSSVAVGSRFGRCLVPTTLAGPIRAFVNAGA